MKRMPCAHAAYPRRRRAALVAQTLAALAAMCPDQLSAQAVVSTAISSREFQRVVDRQSRAQVKVELERVGDKVLVRTSDKAIEVANPETVSTVTPKLPVVADVSKTAQGEIVFHNATLQATKAWETLSPQTRNRFTAVNQAQVKLSGAASVALAPDADNDSVAALTQAVKDTTASLLSTYQQLPATDRAGQRILVEQYRETLRAGKALYGEDDRYPPQTYSQIFANSRGAFGLQLKSDQRPRCSAVLISQKLALTNNHCIQTDLPEDLWAVFDYEDDLSGNHLTAHRFPVIEFRVASEVDRDGLDFAVLELGPDEAGDLPGTVYKPQCLSTVRVRRNDPVYVIGFPEGAPRTVSDHGYVYFPFVVTQEEFTDLAMRVRAEFATKEQEDKSYVDGKLKEFTDSYRKVSHGGVDVYEYYSARFHNQPTIGADCDTFHGNSGSPVYQRHTHDVVGLLFDGQEDVNEPWRVGWSTHEAILPISTVVKRLDQLRDQGQQDWATSQDWRQEPGVCVKS